MNLSAEELTNIENNIINCIKCIYLVIGTSNNMHYIDGLNYIGRLDDNSVDVWVQTNSYQDDVFSLSFDSFGYYHTQYCIDITDSGFDLENDFFQISTVYPFKLSTYQEIRKLRMDMIEKEILYKS